VVRVTRTRPADSTPADRVQRRGVPAVADHVTRAIPGAVLGRVRDVVRCSYRASACRVGRARARPGSAKLDRERCLFVVRQHVEVPTQLGSNFVVNRVSDTPEPLPGFCQLAFCGGDLCQQQQ
jgi:hypothetical protein